jgi:hypothetical protein
MRRSASRSAAPVALPAPQGEGPPPNSCALSCAAADRQAAATAALATAIGEFTSAITPAVTAIHQLSVAQKKLCDLIVDHRLKIFGSIPLVLVAIGAISPNAAKAIGVALKSWGLS